MRAAAPPRPEGEQEEGGDQDDAHRGEERHARTLSSPLHGRGRHRRRDGRRPHRGDEAVTAPSEGLHEPRALGRIAERGADLVDHRAQAVVEVDEGARRPEPLPQLVARHHLSRPLQEDLQHPERLLLELDAPAVLAQLARARVQLERSETEGGGGLLGGRAHGCASLTPAGPPASRRRRRCRGRPSSGGRRKGRTRRGRRGTGRAPRRPRGRSGSRDR